MDYIPELVRMQRSYFLGGATRSVKWRKEQLRKLKQVLRDNESRIAEAVNRDFGKSYFEVMENEIGLLYFEISSAIRRLRSWTKPDRPLPSLVNLPANCRVYPQPFGTVLCISTWNYPVMLALNPVVSAIAAGNTVVLKPSELTANTASLLEEVINSAFPRQVLHVVTGGPEKSRELLQEKFDKILFIGSERVAKIVLKAAAEHLTPVTLELGGKSPVIVLPDCNIKRTAQRLVWGKFHNAGQACVSPDHIYVHSEIAGELKKYILRYVEKMFNGEAILSEGYPRIIDDYHYDRILRMIQDEKVIHGGKGIREKRFIEPTVMMDVSEDDPVMKEEIFGPIMPILTFSNLDELLAGLKLKPSPLALYVFTSNIRLARKILKDARVGGGMINDTVVHFVNSTTPFGGLGESGMGYYHGKAGFETFSQRKTVIKKPNWFELWVKYTPYTKFKLKIIRILLR